MAIPNSFKNVCDLKPSGMATVCEKFQAMFSLVAAMCDFRNWFADANGDATSDLKAFLNPIAMPIGALIPWPMSTLPTGYLLANGQVLRRTDYPSLFAVYGTTFGTDSTDPTNTFKVPDCQDLLLVGASSSHSVGSEYGEAAHTLLEAELPAHRHVLQTWMGHVPMMSAGTWPQLWPNDPAYTVTDNSVVIETTGSNQPFNLMPPVLSVHFIIRAA